MDLGRRITAVAGALVLAWGIFMPAASANVTDDEIAAAQAEESKAAGSVAQIESRLAALEAEAGELELASARAEVASSEAQSRLREATEAARSAQDRADEASYKVEEGRAELGRIGAAMYREGVGSISGANYLLGVDSLAEASDKAHAYDLIGRNAKSDLNEFQALDDVASALQKEADRKFDEQTQAAEAAEKAAQELKEQAAEAAERVAAIDAERDELVTVLAEKHGITKSLVSQQQHERAEAARIRAAEQERLRQEAARVAAQQAAIAAQAQAGAQHSNTSQSAAAQSAAKQKNQGAYNQGSTQSTASVVPAGTAQQIAHAKVRARGWNEDQFSCLVILWNRESGWRTTATNPYSGAYGIPQALPASKMALAGADWRTNPATQIEWGLMYISARYGTPCGALGHSNSVGWY